MALSSRTLIHNWRLKLAALGLSVFLWALVQTEPRNAESFSAPILVEVSDTAWMAVGTPEPAVVELRLSGPTGEIIDLAREGTLVRVPVEAVGSQDTTITLRREWVALGEGTRLSVESVTPSTVQVGFEPAVTRVLPASMRTRGELRNGMALASPIGMNPQAVRVRGPASQMEGLDSVHLVPLDLQTVDESGIYEVAVDTSGLGNARVTPLTASLGVRVEAEVERVLAQLPVQVQAPQDGFDLVVEPARLDVRLRGAGTRIGTVDPRDLTVVAGTELLDGMVPGEERRVPVRLHGVPDLVEATPLTPVVIVRRAGDVQPDPGP